MSKTHSEKLLDALERLVYDVRKDDHEGPAEALGKKLSCPDVPAYVDTSNPQNPVLFYLLEGSPKNNHSSGFVRVPREKAFLQLR